MSTPLLTVERVWKRLSKRPEKALGYAMADLGRDLFGMKGSHRLRPGEFWALQDISFSICPGKVLGVIGQNGAGKSTLIKIISGIINPTHGHICIGSSRVALIDSDGGLNPIQTGRENVVAQLTMYGLPSEAIEEEMTAVAEFAEIGEFIDAPVGIYSLGMRLRLAFSIYSRLTPDLFIIDEALGGGDQQFQNKFRRYLRNYIDNGGAMLLCSHEMIAIQSFCDRCLLLDKGRLVMEGSPVETIDRHLQLCRKRDTAQAHSITQSASSLRLRNENQACLIDAVTVSNANGVPVLRPGESLIVEIDVSVDEVMEVAVGIEIGLGDHEALATITGGYPKGSFILSPPGCRIRCIVDAMPLAPGHYDLRIAFATLEGAVVVASVGYEDSAIALNVEAQPHEISNLARSRNNLIYMNSRWELGVVNDS